MCTIYLMVWPQEVEKRLLNQKNWKKEGKMKYNPKVLKPLYRNFINKFRGLGNFSCSLVFLCSMCDGKHTRTKVMNLNNQSDYSEPNLKIY